MDQGVLENIKCRYKRDLLLRLLNQNETETIPEFTRSLNIKDAVLLAAKSWSEVEQSTISKSWNKLWPIDSGSEPAYEPTLSPTNTMINSLLTRMSIPREERVHWLTTDDEDLGYRDIDEDDIIELVQNEATRADMEEEQDSEAVPLLVSHGRACDAIETVLAYLEQQPDVPMVATVTLNGLLMKAARKRASPMMQTKISDFMNSPNPKACSP